MKTQLFAFLKPVISTSSRQFKFPLTCSATYLFKIMWNTQLINGKMSAYNKTKWCLPLDALSAKKYICISWLFPEITDELLKKKIFDEKSRTYFLCIKLHPSNKGKHANITAQLLSVFQASHHTGHSHSLVRYHRLLEQTEIWSWARVESCIHEVYLLISTEYVFDWLHHRDSLLVWFLGIEYSSWDMERYTSGGEEVRTSWFELLALRWTCFWWALDLFIVFLWTKYLAVVVIKGFYLWILWDFLWCGSVASSIGDLQLALEQSVDECEGIRISISKSKTTVLNQKRVECPGRHRGGGQHHVPPQKKK